MIERARIDSTQRFAGTGRRILQTVFIGASLLCIAGQIHANGSADFTVSLQRCTEFVGVAGVDGAKADALQLAPQPSPPWYVQGNTGASFAAFPGLAPFIANWWRSGDGYATKMNTVIESILFFDASDVSFYTARFNFVGNLIGSHTIRTFAELPVRGTFDSATMQVTVRP